MNFLQKELISQRRQPVSQSISFRNVFFSYDSVLSDCDMEEDAKKGQTIVNENDTGESNQMPTNQGFSHLRQFFNGMIRSKSLRFNPLPLANQAFSKSCIHSGYFLRFFNQPCIVIFVLKVEKLFIICMNKDVGCQQEKYKIAGIQRYFIFCISFIKTDTNVEDPSLSCRG